MLDGLVRGLFLSINKAVYGLLAVVFNLIMNLADFKLFDNTIINTFSSRIYLILGIVMVFKLIVSFIQILIDPDKMNDKENGFGGILRRVTISMILIVTVPTIFSYSRDLQDLIIPVIPRVILATDVDISSSKVASSAGELMSYYSFLPFFYYSDGCANGKLLGTTNDTSTVTISKVDDITNNDINEKCSASSDGYTYRFNYFVALCSGIFLLFTMIMIAKDVAVRTIKFALCQIIAPIPIASYIDPKLSKQTFDNWLSTTVKVYVSLFINLSSVFFIVYVFLLLFGNSVSSTGETVGNIFQQTVGKYGFLNGSLVILFIIIGLIIFAREFPKFMSGMLGIKDGFGDFGGLLKGAWNSARETVGYARNLGRTGISNWQQLSNTTYSDGSKPSTARKIGSVAAGLGGVTANTIRGKIGGKNGAELTRNAFDTTTKRRDDRIATRNRRLSGYSWEEEHAEKVRVGRNISSQDNWSVEEFNQYDKLASYFSDAGALGLKKGEEQAYDIEVAFGPNGEKIRYDVLKQIAQNGQAGQIITSTEKDPITGRNKSFALDDTMIMSAEGEILKRQKANKTEFYSELLRRKDAGAVQIHNQIVDHVSNSTAFTSEKAVDTFRQSLFGKNNQVNINGKIFNKSDFNYDTMIDIIKDSSLFANKDVQSSFKNASETLRNEAQQEQYAAQRRSKARSEANNSGK